jgi:hypothetical protein
MALLYLLAMGSLHPLWAEVSAEAATGSLVTQILGRPSAHSITLNILSRERIEAFVEFGPVAGSYPEKTRPQPVMAGIPAEIELSGLKPDTRYYYRLMTRCQGDAEFRGGSEATFHTQRSPGSTYSFALQGDSHPERVGKMFDASLYGQTVQNVAKENPDFYITMGDDFSIEKLIEQHDLSEASVNAVYAGQRPFLGVVGRSAPLFLVNGNHEQAALFNLDGSTNNPAVLAGRARASYYSLPAPDGFYTGDAAKVDQVGLLRDYYSWTWGDALFVVIDFYWHSPVMVDNKPGARGPDSGGKGGKGGKDGKGGHEKKSDQSMATATMSLQSNVITSVDALGELVPPDQEKRGGGKGGKERDFWGITLGEEQYRWLQKTLSESNARWKFVFCHHVLGTGRGGIERAPLYEWGGRDQNGADLFSQKRPGWAMPIHQLMAKYGVTIFFQGHDHIFARQDLDGIVYQSCPNPGDPTYTAFNKEAYRTGDILPDSGHLKVTVSPEQVDVDYIRSWMPPDLAAGHTNGEVGFHYSIPGSAKKTTPSSIP